MPLFESAEPVPLAANLRWHYHKIAPEKYVIGWLAGAPVGVWCHWLGGSKPCRRKMSQGVLPCPHCTDEGPRIRFLGYVPLFDLSGRRVVVACSTEAWPFAKSLVFATAVRVRRTAGSRDPLKFDTAGDGWAPTERILVGHMPDRLYRGGPQDITPWLLHLWRDTQLTAWLQAQSGSLGTGVHNEGSTPNLVDQEPARTPVPELKSGVDEESPVPASRDSRSFVGHASLPNGKHLLVGGDVELVERTLRETGAKLTAIAVAKGESHGPPPITVPAAAGPGPAEAPQPGGAGGAAPVRAPGGKKKGGKPGRPAGKSAGNGVGTGVRPRRVAAERPGGKGRGGVPGGRAGRKKVK